MDENDENKQENIVEDSLNYILNETTITIVLWLLAAYFVISAIKGNFTLANPNFSFLVRIIDFSIMLLLVLYVLYSYYNIESENREEIVSYSFRELREVLTSPGNNFLNILLYFVILYALLYVLQVPFESGEMPSSIGFLIGLSYVLLILFAILFIVDDLLGIKIVESFFDVLEKMFYGISDDSEEEEEEQTTDASGNVVSENEQVYNVSNNLYTYEEAPYVCQAFNGRLANYDEVEQSYINGGEWCNYGWSQDQLALFPTQKKTWNKLQTSEENKNNCGRPGINGGYFANPNIKFGVNCYGVKPVAKQIELDMMEANKTRPFPKSKQQMMVDRKIKFWKDNADKLLTINSFNRDQWSRY